jgi:hypothetical protein
VIGGLAPNVVADEELGSHDGHAPLDAIDHVRLGGEAAGRLAQAEPPLPRILARRQHVLGHRVQRPPCGAQRFD